MKEYRMSLPKLFEKLIQVFGSISAISGKKILVIRDLEVALMLSVRNAVVYITDDEECAEQFRKNTEAGMGNDDIVFHINNWNNKCKFTKVYEKMGKKFDLVIQNPPYDRNLHLKILEAILPHAEKVINISPIRWLQDPFAPYLNRSDYIKFETSVSKHIKDLEIIPAKKASELFQEASFTMNLGIYTCDAQGGYDYTHNDPLVNKIVTKTMENSWEPFSLQNFYRNGGMVRKSFELFTSYLIADSFMLKTYEAQLKVGVKDYQIQHYISGKSKGGAHFEFDTEDERKNFYSCYNSQFMQWYCNLINTDHHTHCSKIPYFNDFTKPWTNEMFKKYFDLTDEEWSRIEKEMAAIKQ